MPIPDCRTLHGRVHVNRAAIMARLGVAESTLERWYRGRDHNGHPAGVVVGRALYFDEEAFLAWHQQRPAGRRRARPRPTGRLSRDGRMLINRAEVARLTGLPEHTQANLYQHRARNGHPEGVRVGQSLYFDKDTLLGWLAARRNAKRATLTEVDRSGDPEDLVNTTEAARVLGFAGRGTIESYLARDGDYFPAADDTEPLSGGRVRRRWKRRTLWEFAATRSRAGRAGTAHAWSVPDTRLPTPLGDRHGG